MARTRRHGGRGKKAPRQIVGKKTLSNLRASVIAHRQEQQKKKQVTIEVEILDSGFGYEEEVDSPEQGNHEERHRDDLIVEKLICGDGSTQRNGYVLESDVIYASSNVNGGPEQMYALDASSLNVNGSRMQYDVQAETIETRRLPRSEWPEHPLFATSGLEPTPTANGNVVTSWLRTNPGFALQTGRPGDRASTPLTRKYLMTGSQFSVIRGTNGECAITAIANATAAVTGNRSLGLHMQQWLRLCGKAYNRLGTSTEDIIASPIHVELRKVPRPNHSLRHFSCLREGVFIVRLMRGNDCDHVVAVDCDRMMILDGEESFPSSLDARCLALCTGGEGTTHNVRVAEVRQMMMNESRITKRNRDKK